jgi:ribonucleoside-diphosphate reductase beta chain
VRITTPKTTYTFDYPEAIEAANQQIKLFWLPDEIAVEKDIQDIRVNMTEAERHGVITTLKLFTLYELFAGNEYWGSVVAKRFPRPDIQRMASCFQFFELNVHAPFYAKLNESLGLDTDDFYNEYTQNPILKERMEFIEGVVGNQGDALDLAISVGVFSIIEGAVLYSSFAYLKHFQAQGKNLLNNVVAGINFSQRDELCHAEAGAWLYRQYMKELNPVASKEYIETCIYEAARKVYEHESKIIDMIFEKGQIKGITEHQMKNFVQSRINICLKNLNLNPIFEVGYNPIASWFYKGVNGVQFHDFFVRVGSEYNRDWDERSFTW